MNTSNQPNESVSLLADGEATAAEIDAALAALATDEGRAAWAAYHRVGDALRSDELATQMSADFLPALFARLEQEPAIVAPVAAVTGHSRADADTAPGLARRFALPGLVAAAAAGAAAFALVGGSQLMVAQHEPEGTAATPLLASATLTPAASGALSASVRQASARQGELLRDPDIDQYLLAHQRFSPSPYSTAQFARSPAFANESDK